MDPSRNTNQKIDQELLSSFDVESQLERDLFAANIKTLVDSGWRVKETAASKEYIDQFRGAMERVEKILTGTAIRNEGLQIIPTNCMPNLDLLPGLMETMIGPANQFKSQSDRLPFWNDAPTLYHCTQMLDFLVLRHVGWIAPNDLEWLRLAKVGHDPKDWGNDYGFSLSTSLAESASYLNVGSSMVEDIYKAIGQPLPEVFKEVLNIGVVLTISTSDLKSSFPPGKFFWRGTDHHEYACPMVPYFREQGGLEVLALVELKKNP